MNRLCPKYIAQCTQDERVHSYRVDGRYSIPKFLTTSFTSSTWCAWSIKLIEWGLANSLSLPITHVEQFADFGWKTLARFLPIVDRFSRATVQDTINKARIKDLSDHVTSHWQQLGNPRRSRT